MTTSPSDDGTVSSLDVDGNGLWLRELFATGLCRLEIGPALKRTSLRRQRIDSGHTKLLVSHFSEKHVAFLNLCIRHEPDVLLFLSIQTLDDSNRLAAASDFDFLAEFLNEITKVHSVSSQTP